ncbi:MAG: dTDP-glucose 4,6-dehydratase [bacterium]|nr:dTDP-glucose 4,6-dehydratase [bacterium]
MENILITGGCGFIGSNFIRHIYHAHPNFRIFNIDVLTYAGNPENLRDIERLESEKPKNERRYQFICGDICDDKLLAGIFSMYDFSLVINFAAETHVDRSIISMTDFIRTNIGGVRALIEAVRNYEVPRFVHISTDEIYGDVLQGYSTEDTMLRPSNPYSSSKAAADLIVQSFIRTHRVPAIIIRGSNNYGPYQYPEKLIPLAVTNLIEGKKIPVHGKGGHMRSWLHVEDFCRAIDLIATQGPLYEIFNVSGEEKTNLEVLTMIARHLGKDLSVHKEHINDRPGADLRYAPDSTKLKKALGWQPMHRIEDSMGDVAQWYLNNREWWNAIKTKKEFLEHYVKQSKGQWS